jgi:hypothetical protein
MPVGVAAASDESGRRVPGPTPDRPGVSRRGGAGGTLELLRSGDGVRRAASWRVRREPRANGSDLYILFGQSVEGNMSRRCDMLYTISMVKLLRR